MLENKLFKDQDNFYESINIKKEYNKFMREKENKRNYRDFATKMLKNLERELDNNVLEFKISKPSITGYIFLHIIRIPTKPSI